MIGFRIAITGLVIAAFFLWLGAIAKAPPQQRALMRVFGVLFLIGMFMTPLGLIIQIWQ